MKNFVFISPNFPINYRFFCLALRNNGINVLGIGDQSYDSLDPLLKDSLTEYYRVDTLENYDSVRRAVAFFIFRYGAIDYLESNNEYWLEQDARLRTDFHITSGFQLDDMPLVKLKSRMKEAYHKAGIPTARYHLVDDEQGCLEFIRQVSYPVIVKPDNGVGASDTRKICSDAQLRGFLGSRNPHITYIMEEFITAVVNSYDAIIDSRGEPLFETGNVTPQSIMDIVNDNDNSLYYIVKDLAPDVRDAGRRTVKAFGVRSRFVHFEFFRLTQDQAIGKKGDVVALEVNMRPSGGYSPDMMNYANSIDVYRVYADMIAYDSTLITPGERQFCAFAGRRDGKAFALDDDALQAKYASHIRMRERIPDALSGAMGNRMFMAVFPTEEEMNAFYADSVRAR